MIRSVRLRTLVTTAALLLVACGGGETRIESNDLGRIMPSAVDAPAGTTIDTGTGGSKSLDEFITDADVKTRLRSLGFRAAYVAAFATANYVPDKEKAPPGSALYASFAILLENEDAARKGFTFYEARLKTRAKNVTTIVTTDVGDEVFSFRFSELDDAPLPGLAILWRRGNALFSVVGVGNPNGDPAAVRALADTIDGRAAKKA